MTRRQDGWIWALEAAVTDETAAVLVQSPNFFGTD
jgi:hypothetical protein